MRKIIIITIVFLSLAVLTYAQPAPPTSPSGNQVPIGSLSSLGLILGGAYLYFKNKKNNRK